MDGRFLHFVFAYNLLSSLVTAQTATDPQQIFTLAAFSQQQTCVQECFTSNIACITDLVGSVIGCPIAPCTLSDGMFGAADSCYCRGDLQAAAESYISSCVQKACSIGDTSSNVATAVSLYAGYCTSLGYTAYPANNDAETTAAGSSPTSSDTSKATNTGGLVSDPTDSSSSTDTSGTSGSSSSSSSSSKTTLYIALAVVGGLAAILFLAAATWASKYRKLKQRRQMFYPTATTTPYGGYAQSMRMDNDVFPHESASNVGVPPPSVFPYPHPIEPSLISTRMR